MAARLSPRESYRRIKELQPDASQRAIAKAVGVGKGTVERALSGPNGPEGAAKPLKNKGQKNESGPNGPPPWLAQPASETAEKLRVAAQHAAIYPDDRKGGRGKSDTRNHAETAQLSIGPSR